MNSLFKKITGFIGIYFLIRIFSYFFPPDTPLHEAHVLNTIVSGLLILVVVFLFFKKQKAAWYIIAGELILGGSGNFFAFFGVSLRTILLIVSVGIFFILHGKKTIELIKKNKYTCCTLFGLLLIVCFSSLRGIFFGHNFKLLIADTLPYLFLLYYFPLSQLAGFEKFKSTCLALITTGLIGNTLFSLFTFFGFGFGLFHIQDTYYHWFRDVANGKITDLGSNFFRTVLNEQFLIIPLLLISVSKLIYYKKEIGSKISLYKNLLWFSSSLIILSITITRVYLLALVIGLLLLCTIKEWKRWLVLSLVTIVTFIFLFTTFHFIVSRGTSLGWELFGFRIQSIVKPQTETSSLSRMLLLKPIFEKIKEHPIIGNGLGSVVTVYSPGEKKMITTPQFDWGYLEIIAELGLIGFGIWILVLLGIVRKKFAYPNFSNIVPLISICIITLTGPILFHVFGIVWIVYELRKQTIITE